MITSNLISFIAILIISNLVGYTYSVNLVGQSLIGLLSSPIVFYILITLTVSFFNFLGFPVKTISAPILTIYTLVSLFLLTKKYKSNPTMLKLNKSTLSKFLLITLFALINSFIILSPVLQHDTWYFYNDHTTYISQAEYLQEHSFFNLANPDSQPWTQDMYMYQSNSMRIGSQFFISFLRTVLNAKHTILIYPAIAAFSQYLLTLSISILALLISKNINFLIISLFFTTISIHINQSILLMGFLPQTFGITLYIYLFFLISAFIKKGLTKKLYFLNTLSFSALVITYQEIVPFFVLSYGLLFLHRLFKKNNFIFSTSYFLSIILFPISSLLLIKGLLNQHNVLVGWNKTDTFLNYFLSIFGQDSFIYLKNPSLYLGPISIFILTIVVIKNIIKQNKIPTILIYPLLSFSFSIFCFKLFTINPFDGRIGNNWSVYKLVQWSYWIYILVFSYYLKKFINTNLFSYFLFILLIPSFLANLKIIKDYNSHTITSTFKNNSDTFLTNYKHLVEITKEKKYIPANLFLHNAHPNVAHLPLSITKDNSIPIISTINNSNNILNKITRTPSLSNQYFQWIYEKNTYFTSQNKIYNLAGFDIFPGETSFIHFCDGFKDTYDIDQSVNLEKLEGEIRIFVPENSIANISFDLMATSKGELSITSNNNYISKSVFIMDDSTKIPLKIDNLPTGFYQILITWDQISDNSNSQNQGFIKLTNSTITSKIKSII